MLARIISILAGVWFFISVFFWPHSAAQTTNCWASGVLVIGFAALAMAQPGARFLNTILGLWIFFSAWVVPSETTGEIWNALAVGVVVFACSLVPGIEPSGEESGWFRGHPREPHRPFHG